jgi:TM2 domain-containing membrane protein YozV
MKKLKMHFTLLIIFLIVLTSATVVSPISKGKTTINPTDKLSPLIDAINIAKADGKITKTELRSIFTIAKGSKLSFKEKLAINIFNKKIGNKLIAETVKGGDGKSKTLTIILVIFLGFLGIHRFYLGYYMEGLIQLFTLGGCGIWWLIDIVRVLIGDLNPKDEEYSDR